MNGCQEKPLKKEIEKVGFKINEKKVSMQHKTARQTATGLVVNKKVNIKREYYKQARSMCHSLFQTDTFYLDKKLSEKIEISENAATDHTSTAESAETSTTEPEPEEFTYGTINQLDGILSFIYHLKKSHDTRKFTTKFHQPTAISKLYRQFLFYKHFFSLKQPLIICEGKTDIIYLRCALRQLIKKYPEFIDKKEEKYRFKVRFFNFTKNLKDVFSISEGTSGLASLIEIYKKP